MRGSSEAPAGVIVAVHIVDVIGAARAAVMAVQSPEDQPQTRAIDAATLVASVALRIPTKPAMHSNLKPATYSDAKPAGVPI